MGCRQVRSKESSEKGALQMTSFSLKGIPLLVRTSAIIQSPILERRIFADQWDRSPTACHVPPCTDYRIAL